ncbi:MAG: CPBP family intramembrane glutamic endopeptidase [Salinirussus sp.]
MPRWVPFVGLTIALVILVLVLARHSTSVLRRTAQDTHSATDVTPDSLSTRTLLLNVTISQGVVIAILAAGIVAFGIPLSALGIDTGHIGQIGLQGMALGVTLWLASETGSRLADAAGVAYDEALRERLAPSSTVGWIWMLLVVLPVVAIGEELLFRAALIGVPAAGLGLSPWILAAVSTGAFALGHGAQGRIGILATGALGAVLAAAFVLTESFGVVVIAHYVVDTLEFVVHEA